MYALIACYISTVLITDYMCCMLCAAFVYVDILYVSLQRNLCVITNICMF